MPSDGSLRKDSSNKTILRLINANKTSCKMVNLSPFTVYRAQIAAIVNKSRMFINDIVFTTEKLGKYVFLSLWYSTISFEHLHHLSVTKIHTTYQH